MKKKRNNPAAMRCPYCGSPVILRSADGIYRENANGTMSEAHIGCLGEYYCRQVIDACRAMLASYNGCEAS